MKAKNKKLMFFLWTLSLCFYLFGLFIVFLNKFTTDIYMWTVVGSTMVLIGVIMNVCLSGIEAFRDEIKDKEKQNENN